jgi:hypothetical protein
MKSREFQSRETSSYKLNSKLVDFIIHIKFTSSNSNVTGEGRANFQHSKRSASTQTLLKLLQIRKW